MLRKRDKIFLLFCALGFAGLGPGTALGFDWPSGATITEKIQVLKQEIYNLKTLIASARSQKGITAAAYLAIDLSDNSARLQKNADKAYPIASVTKLMTAVVASENIDTQETITLTKNMLAPAGGSPTLFAGLDVSAQNLLQASLIQSTNDAAESLAYFLGKDKFLALMNKKAEECAMANTAFSDVSGISSKNRSTAADVAKLLVYIHKNHPEILDTTKNNNFWLPDKTGKLLKFLNLNNFYYYPGFIGGKSGYSPQARQTFAGLFDIDGKRVAIVVLRSADYQADVLKVINQLKN